MQHIFSNEQSHLGYYMSCHSEVPGDILSEPKPFSTLQSTVSVKVSLPRQAFGLWSPGHYQRGEYWHMDMGGEPNIYRKKKKKECKKTVWDLMANWGGVSGIGYPRVHFSDNDTAGMLITTHCAGDLNVSWAQMWFSVSYWSLRELFSAAGADWLLTYWFAHHPAVQGGLTAPLLFSSVVIRSCK